MSNILIRLDKFLADRTGFSRSQIKQKLKNGCVTVNGNITKTSDYKINPDADIVAFMGEELDCSDYFYYMLNKPAGVVSATEDSYDKTVVSLLPPNLRKNVFPVGRLDKDTEGLLLLTNDGVLAHELLSPKKHVDKEYFVRLALPVGDDYARIFNEGIDIGEKNITLPAVLKQLSQYECLVTIREGKFHQIKRMFKACGNEVVYLKRLAMGSLKLDENLALGEYRELTDEELGALKKK